MNNESIENEETENSSLKENVGGIGQMIIGEIEAIGGILTGDPLTRAEGEFNVAVGEERDDIEEELEEGTPKHLEK